MFSLDNPLSADVFCGQLQTGHSAVVNAVFYRDRVITSRDQDSTPTLIVNVVASLCTALHDDYFCLVALNKQQINW